MRLLLNFTIPLVMGNLFQQIYNLADTIIVGRILGANALAAVGASTSIIFLIIGFVTGTCSGFAIPVAQRFGAKDESAMRRFVLNGAYLAAGLAITLAIITSVLCMTILKRMGTPAEILSDAYAYLIVIFIGIPFTFLYNLLAGIIRALGDSRTPFLFLMVSTILNIILDFVFIIYFQMGVMGASVATVLAQAVSGILCLIFMIRKFTLLRPQKDEARPEPRKMKILLYIGIPMGLQFSITAIGSIMLQTAINSLGTVYITGYAVAMKIKQLAMAPYDAIGNAAATFCGQNLGAGKYKRIYQGFRSGMVIGLSYSVIAVCILIFGGTGIARLFMNDASTSVLAAAQQYMTTIGIFFFLLGGLIIARSTIQGVGYSMLAFFAGILEMIARTVVSVFGVPKFGYTAACFADPVAWAAGILFLVPLFFIVMRKIQGNRKKI